MKNNQITRIRSPETSSPSPSIRVKFSDIAGAAAHDFAVEYVKLSDQQELLCRHAERIAFDQIQYMYFFVYSTQTMRYLHDPAKKAANFKKHGLDFDDAPKVIESDANVTFEDRRFDYGEPRFITLGLLDGEVVVVVTTETDQEIRVISMRKAKPNEQAIYFRNLGR